MFDFKTLSMATLVLLFSPSVFAEGIAIENAWIREAPPVSRVQAAYAVFNNTSNNDAVLIAASSRAFKKIEFHKTVLENGLTRMLHQKSVTILNKEHVAFKPEGMHMMLFNPVKPLRSGDKINIMFTFKNGETTAADFIIKKASHADPHKNMHH